MTANPEPRSGDDTRSQRRRPGRQASVAERKNTYMELKLPIQGVVDRGAIIDTYMLPNPVLEPGGSPKGLPLGALPGDPAWFPAYVNPRLAVCQILSRYAAAPCLRARGYF